MPFVIVRRCGERRCNGNSVETLRAQNWPLRSEMTFRSQSQKMVFRTLSCRRVTCNLGFECVDYRQTTSHGWLTCRLVKFPVSRRLGEASPWMWNCCGSFASTVSFTLLSFEALIVLIVLSQCVLHLFEGRRRLICKIELLSVLHNFDKVWGLHLNAVLCLTQVQKVYHTVSM